MSKPLTQFQLEVLAKVAMGVSRVDIAKERNVSPKTVEFHCKRVMDKLGIHSVAKLTHWAIAKGLVELMYQHETEVVTPEPVTPKIDESAPKPRFIKPPEYVNPRVFKEINYPECPKCGVNHNPVWVCHEPIKSEPKGVGDIKLTPAALKLIEQV